ncbi:hypothetical protein QBC34DRAFT_354168 [Podospora aff. communis PSN243]|uniref:NAD-dependent epimerase/dehydratase domain-containing protein n=1 Tax=Podospora aff. communis PSN243 TaxID=3040156 RepID=A0AAV9GIM0_9PEZI|nr:hypothetical protein QBC34DRAFT_354168 [Podospora aff. communis PSN243]
MEALEDTECCEECSTSSSSPASLPTASPLTTPELSDNGSDIDRRHSTTRSCQPPVASNQFVLVIGGLGYIGSHTVLELLRAGYNVVVVDNLSNSYESVLHNITTLIEAHCQANGTTPPLLHFHRLDYRSRSMCLLLESYSDLVITIDASGKQHMTYSSRITGVIHFAAYKSVLDSIKRPLHYYQNNVCGLVSLLQRLDAYGIHNFIFSSSATVYGSKANSGLPLREDDLTHDSSPASSAVGLSCPYARTKYFAEAILADAAVANPHWRIVALRYFNPVGCDPSGLLGESPRAEATNLYPILSQVLTGARPALDVFGTDWKTRDGTAIRDFIHVLDVARGHIAALAWNTVDNNASDTKTGSGGFRAFNLGSGSGTTVLEAVRSLEEAAKKTIPVRWAGRRPGDVGACVASTERAERELGWVPREGIAQCAADLWNFVRKAVKPAQ